MDREILLNLSGEFSYAWGQTFFIETEAGNFVWSDPAYNGDNTIRRFHGNLNQFLKRHKIPFVRDKGFHRIGDYCGNQIRFVQ